ncbi:MAG: DUF3473 domain-containing protein [Bacteroidales bacterium]|nr:DUF3473 domain-containing protein [Bacteroidales bacterium]
MQSENSVPDIKSSITVDLEDGINILMKDQFNILMPPTERAVINTDILLDLFEKHETKVTFFILGEIAHAFPELIKKIDSFGHEIGAHGYRHDQLFKLTPEEVATDISKSKRVLENIIGKPVLGYRAPAFSIIPENAWALEIIAEAGFKYDSSIVPIKMKRYGWKEFEKQIIRLQLPNNFTLIEVPIPVVSIMGHSFPVCGGGYLRYFPLNFTNWAFSSIVKDRSVIVYLHPYELDTIRYPDFFYSARKTLNIGKSLPLMIYRFKKGTVKEKLNSMLLKYKFIPLIDIIRTLETENAIGSIRLGNSKTA